MNHEVPEVNSPIPLARLDLYNEAIIMTKFGHNSSTSYPVSIHDLACAFGQVPASSGFLPPNTLFHGRVGGQEFMGIYFSSSTNDVTVEEETMTIPFPSAIFIGCGKQYKIYAVTSYPKNQNVVLYRYPSPNVWSDGRICAGDTPFPTCTPESIIKAFKLFIESRFNTHLSNNKCKSHPSNIISLWETLDGQEEFPITELVLSTASLRAWV